ncbi:hypothetical protein F4775DRAFT_559066, partial [Biscogniauxia sp. FL1348]
MVTIGSLLKKIVICLSLFLSPHPASSLYLALSIQYRVQISNVWVLVLNSLSLSPHFKCSSGKSDSTVSTHRSSSYGEGKRRRRRKERGRREVDQIQWAGGAR